MTSLSKTLLAIMKRPVPTAMDISQPIQGRPPSEWSHFINDCVKKRAEERFSTVIMMRREFNRISDGFLTCDAPVLFRREFFIIY